MGDTIVGREREKRNDNLVERERNEKKELALSGRQIVPGSLASRFQLNFNSFQVL